MLNNSFSPFITPNWKRVSLFVSANKSRHAVKEQYLGFRVGFHLVIAFDAIFHPLFIGD